MDPDTAPSRRKLEYNLIWMERTFKERATTEALLAPERDSGVLTQHDYEAAVKFLPGYHRHYNTFGTVLGAAASYAVRRPKWQAGKTAGFVIFGAFSGRAIGSALAVWSHYKFIKTIQEPERFSQAMENVQQRLGQPILKGPPIIMRPKPSDPNHSSTPNGDFADSPDPYSRQPPPFEDPQTPIESSPAPLPPPTSAAHQPQTSWDRIRQANNKGAQQSSWDVIRQNHEKSEMQRRPPPPSSSDPRHRDGYDRSEEQAKFDAMLERERTFKPNA